MTVLKKEQSLYAIPEGVDPELLMKVLGNPERWQRCVHHWQRQCLPFRPFTSILQTI